MSNLSKIVVFSGDLNYSVRKGIAQIDRAIPGLSWLVVFYLPKKTTSQVLRSQWRNLQRNGWRWIFYQISEVLRGLLARVPDESPPSVPGSEFTIESLRSRTNIQLLKVASILSADALEAVDAFAPDLGLSLAAPILPRSLFARPRLGTVNLHKGKLPDYRGMPPAFWELWNGEHSVGCTVHWVDDKLDTGPLVAQSTVDREEFSTLRGIQLSLDEVGVDLMRHAVVEVLQGTSRSAPQKAGGKTYRKPTLSMFKALDRKLALEWTTQSSQVKRLSKDAFGTTTYALWRTGLRSLVEPRITVIL